MQISKVQTKYNNQIYKSTKIYKNVSNSYSISQNINKTITPIYNISFQANLSKVPTMLERFEGCILGGAIGDALGAPLEFKSLSEIKKIYGKKGIRDLQIGFSTGLAEITDDTQMTIYTIDGLLRGLPKSFNSNKKIDINILYDSYKQWYNTQTESMKYKKNTSWINNLEDLYIQKEPGNTCLSALAGNIIGTTERPINNSKGSGCVMRVAPIGLLYNANPHLAFEIGKESAALTHGNPTGYLSAGLLSSIIAYLTRGENLKTAINKTILYLKNNYNNSNEAKNLINKILDTNRLVCSNISNKQAINMIGRGWIADEALSLSLFCALRKSDNFVEALRLAVNHSGDSDTVGAITGNILGCIKGSTQIPLKWLNILQFRQTLKTLATDLYNAPKQTVEISEKYPFYGNKIPRWYKISDPNVPIETPKKLEKVKFSDADMQLMANMSIEEKIKYKQYLIKNKKFEF